MPVHNADIAGVFIEIADLLELQEDNPFRIRAYRRAARTILELGSDVKDYLESGGDLTELPGIGKDLAGKIREISDTGSVELLRKLRQQVPPGMPELLQLTGLGPKRIRKLHQELGISSLEDLSGAIREGKVRNIPGFGEKTEQRMRKSVEARKSAGRRFLLSTASQYALPLAEWLRNIPGVKRVEIGGSFRRGRETVGDIDILVAADGSSPVMDRFVRYDEVREVLAHGATRSSVVLASGLQVDIRVVEEESFGAALHYFTGSKTHNIAIRRLGQEAGLKINEYGVFRGEKRIAGGDEKSVFRAVGLPWIPPELREDHGEIEAARRGRLPELVIRADLRGDLHMHTRATDGRNTLEEMALAAREAGLEYIAVTEHSRRLTMVHGLDVDGLRRQGEEIDRLNARLRGITVLKGIEVDILEDGSLDLPDSALDGLDLVVAAVHSRFNLPRAAQTRRLIRAVENPRVNILAHPTGRLLLEREPYDADFERVIRRAVETGCILEVNAHPERLDLSDSHCRLVRDAGGMVAVSSDGHSTSDFRNLDYGVSQCRRGWIGPDRVANTRPLRELKKLLRRRRAQ